MQPKPNAEILSPLFPNSLYFITLDFFIVFDVAKVSGEMKFVNRQITALCTIITVLRS